MVKEKAQVFRTVGLHPEVFEKLEKLGTVADSKNSVIEHLIDFWEQNHVQ
jgi:hypothetical protein